MKWGEYSNDVQFILQWNESSKNHSFMKNKPHSPVIPTPSTPNIIVDSTEKQNKDIQKLIT